MIKRINKKIFFRVSLLVSGFLAFFFNTTNDDAHVMLKVLDIPIGSIEKAYAVDGSDCCGCGCDGGGMVFPTTTSSGNGVQFVAPTVSPASYSCGGCGGCFIAGTKVILADGSLKNIEDVALEESLATADGSNVVEKLFTIPYIGEVYAFNGSEHYFFTQSHPFMTTDGWKSMNPAKTKEDNDDLEVGQLSVGDTLVKSEGNTEVILSIESKKQEITVYNFRVSGDHGFYADGYLVHNLKQQNLVE